MGVPRGVGPGRALTPGDLVLLTGEGTGRRALSLTF